MARTRDIPPATQNAAANNAPKGKRSREVDVEQPAPGKKAKTAVSKSKRQCKVDNPPTVESEQVVATKKTRTGKDPKVSEPRAPHTPARCSGRAHTTTLTAPPKRKRRTKEEIAADKAKADQEKR